MPDGHEAFAREDIRDFLAANALRARTAQMECVITEEPAVAEPDATIIDKRSARRPQVATNEFGADRIPAALLGPSETSVASHRAAVQLASYGPSDAGTGSPLNADLQASPRLVAQRRLIDELFPPQVASTTSDLTPSATSRSLAQGQASDAVRRQATGLEGVAQREPDDYNAYDFDDQVEDEDQDTVDPELAEYLAPRPLPTFGDYYAPALDKFRKEQDAKTKAERLARRRQQRETRRERDEVEHADRRMLNRAAAIRRQQLADAEDTLAAQRGRLVHMVKAFDGKKSKAGQKKASLGNDAESIWETHRTAINQLDEDFKVHKKSSRALVEEAEKQLGDFDSDVAVPTEQLKQLIVTLTDLLNRVLSMNKRLAPLLPRAESETEFLDKLIGTGTSASGPKVVKYNNLYIHDEVSKCPLYRNIPFDELNRLIATGTHGKSADGKFVHKKVAGGIAITFGYVTGQAWVIDWGRKASGSNKYAWKRGSVDYDSNAGIGDRNKYFQV